ncbi:hypothetical protein D3Z38_07780 [Clostridiales bacterium]|nr:hypothetical protein [Clostridiales bacterium]
MDHQVLMGDRDALNGASLFFEKHSRVRPKRKGERIERQEGQNEMANVRLRETNIGKMNRLPERSNGTNQTATIAVSKTVLVQRKEGTTVCAKS